MFGGTSGAGGVVHVPATFRSILVAEVRITGHCNNADLRAVKFMDFGSPQVTTSGCRGVAPDYLRLASLKAF